MDGTPNPFGGPCVSERQRIIDALTAKGETPREIDEWLTLGVDQVRNLI